MTTRHDGTHDGSTLQAPLRMLARLVAHHPGRAAIAAILGLVVGALGWAIPIQLQVVLDHRGDLSTIAGITLAVALGTVLRSAFSVLRKHVQMALARGIEQKLALRYLGHALRLDIAEYDRLPRADLLNRLHGLEQVRTALEDRVLGVVFDVVLVAVAAAIMARTSIPLALLASAGAILPAVVVFFIKRIIRDSFKETQELGARLTGTSTDALDGIRDLRVAGAEEWFVGRLERDYVAVQDKRARHHLMLTVIGNTTGLLSTLLSILILFVGAHAVHDGSLTNGQLLFAFSMAGSMLGPIESLVISWLFFEDAAGALERCQQVLALPAEPRVGPRELEDVKGDIALEHVTFGYKPGQPVLHDVSLRIPAGQSVAIVGESGAGKTTLLHLLTGLYRPTEGRVLADGRDLKDWDRRSWRRQIGVVYQSPHLFQATVEENLRLGNSSVDLLDLDHALRDASAQGFVSRLEEGTATPLLAGGAPFSGGQAQRLAIARALARHPKVLLLDEATSNLDLDTESAVWSALEKGKGKRTTVFVTHRLSSSARADRIVVMDGGAITEQGSYSELLEAKGRYHQLWKRQNAMENS